MADEDRHYNWSDALETLIASEAEKARVLAWINRKCEQYYGIRNNLISIPVIVLSTLAGTASVGSSSLFPGETQLGSVVIGLVSIGVGILNTIGSYFSFGKKSENHRIAYLHYNKIFSAIAIELSLPREERLPPDQILKQMRESMERLAETTPTPPQSILDLFNRHFKNEDKGITRPAEVNGLQKVQIYRAISPKNITVKVDEERPSDTGEQRSVRERRARTTGSEDTSDVSGQEARNEARQRRPSYYPPRENPKREPLPESLRQSLSSQARLVENEVSEPRQEPKPKEEVESNV